MEYMQSNDKQIKIFTSAVAVGAGVTGVTSQNGSGLTVARTGVGTYTLTLDKRMYALVGANVIVQGSTLEYLYGQVTEFDNTTTPNAPVVTMKLFKTDTAAAADVANACTLLFTLIMKNSSLTR